MLPLHRTALGVSAGILTIMVAAPAQVFVDRTATSGLGAVATSNGGEGSGLCCADFDLDGDLDLVVPGRLGLPIQYFRNDGGIGFTDLTAQMALGTSLDPRAIVAADVDNDGDPDFVIGNLWLPMQLFINNGNGTFTEEAVLRGLLAQSSVYSLSFGDYDRDGWLDLYVGNRQGPGITGSPNVLYRGTGNGHFADVSVAAGVDHLGLTYAAVFFDYDEDGWPDIYCANDKGVLGVPNTVFHNDGNGSFSDVSAQINAAQVIDGMGVDFVDVFNDGGMDVYCSDTPVDHLFLEWNPGTGQYVDQTYTYGLMGGGLGWAVNWLDYDNDGWQDLHVVQNGTPNLLFHNPALPAAATAPWTDVAFPLGLAAFSFQYATVTVDLDDDGGMDIVNRFESAPFPPNQRGVTVHHNQVPRGNWLKFRTRGVVSNRDGFGARIEIDSGNLRQRQYVRNGTGFLSGSDPRVHFGLGTATQADRVTVTWPSGQVQVLGNVAANQIVELVEPTFTLSAPVQVGGTSSLDLSIQGDQGLLYGMVLAFAESPRSQLPDGRFLPLQLDALSSYTFIPGNTLLGNPLAWLDANGHASSTISIPNQPGLVGVTLFATAATVPPQGLPAIKTIFPAPVRITIQ